MKTVRDIIKNTEGIELTDECLDKIEKELQNTMGLLSKIKNFEVYFDTGDYVIAIWRKRKNEKY